MKKNLAIVFALIGWLAVIMQLVIMIENRTASIPETIVRFFSFFTILTNLLVAIYFISQAFLKKHTITFVQKPGVLSAITLYITMVGLVYQFALRHIWQPQGMQWVVDELLHSVIPILVIIFWYLFEKIKSVSYSQTLKWAIYPLGYLVCILIRGRISNFYPYYFIDISNLGLTQTLLNAGVLLIVFLLLSVIFLFLGKEIIKQQKNTFE